MHRKWANGSSQNFVLGLKIIVPDLRSSVITLKVLWFNLILDLILILIFLCLSYSCDGKFHSQIAVKFFSSTKRGYKWTLVQSKSCFNLPYRQSFFFFTAEQHRELREIIHYLDIWHKSAKLVKALTDVRSQIYSLININLKMQWTCL